LREDVENEDEDPVIDAEFEDEPIEEIEKETIAIIPGAFKPPHKGHAEMVQAYAVGTTGEGENARKIAKADKIIILISKPTIQGRYLPIQGTEIVQEHAIEIWENIFLPDIRAMSDVEIIIDSKSDYASPVQAALDYISDNGTLDPMTQRVVLGASDKPDNSGVPDWHRWIDVDKYAKEIVDPEGEVHKLEILDPKANAVSCSVRACGINFSATDMRKLVSILLDNPNNKEAEDELAEFIPREHIDVLLTIFRNKMGPAPLKKKKPEQELDEISAMGIAGGGDITIGAGMRGIDSRPAAGKRDKKLKKKKKQQENVDISLVDDVIRLIMERGIAQ